MDKEAMLLKKDHYTFKDLENILTFLRSPKGCPWDRAQTHSSIRKNLIEECYEAVEGIDLNDHALLCEELGDILLQVIFHTCIAQEEGAFDMQDVLDGICRKMINRHPHIFADEEAESPEKAYSKWEEIKKKEKKTATTADSLGRIAKTLPSLMRTQKLLLKAEKAALIMGTPAVESKEEILKEYFVLCLKANALGINLEECAYAENEQFIAEMKRREESKKIEK